MYSIDVWALPQTPCIQGLPRLRSIVPIGAPKVRQLEKRLHRSNSAAREQTAFKFRKMVLRGSTEDAELSNPI